MNRIAAIFILAALLATTGLCAAVERDVWVFEDFSSGTFPPAGWTISAHASNWGESASANAGADSPELRFNWSPQFTGDSYFISPSYDTSGETTIYLDLRHFVDHYSSPFTVGAATRSDGGAWNTVWSLSPTGNVGPQLQTVEISNADVGSEDFQFALYFSGNSYNIDYWYVDDVKLYTPFPYDLAILGTYILDHVDSGTPSTPACEVKNVGLNALTATVSLFIYRGDELEASHPDYYSALLDPGQSETASFPDFTPSLPDELYRFDFSITSVEDVPDDDPENNY
ncbi:MAG: choice-of-anchor J domain-containing protein, partial [Candidatus Syntrophosphaera sp.]